MSDPNVSIPRPLVKRAIQIIEREMEVLYYSHTIYGAWADDDLAQDDYKDMQKVSDGMQLALEASPRTKEP